MKLIHILLLSSILGALGARAEHFPSQASENYGERAKLSEGAVDHILEKLRSWLGLQPEDLCVRIKEAKIDKEITLGSEHANAALKALDGVLENFENEKCGTKPSANDPKKVAQRKACLEKIKSSLDKLRSCVTLKAAPSKIPAQQQALKPSQKPTTDVPKGDEGVDKKKIQEEEDWDDYDLDELQKEGDTKRVLEAALDNNDMKTLESFIKAGKVTLKIGNGLFTKAANENKVVAIKLLLDNKVADINALNIVGRLALAQAVFSNSFEAMKELIARGALVQGASQALFVAAFRQNVKALNELITQGATIDATDKNGYTALMHAAQSNEVDAIRMLLKHGAHIETRVLEVAIKKNRLEAVELLLEHSTNTDYQALFDLLELMSKTNPKVNYEKMRKLLELAKQKQGA